MKRFKDLTDEELSRIVRIAVIVGIFIFFILVFVFLRSQSFANGDIPPLNQTDGPPPHMSPWEQNL